MFLVYHRLENQSHISFQTMSDLIVPASILDQTYYQLESSIVTVGRYAIVVGAATFTVYLLKQHNINVISAIGNLDASLPIPKLPNLNVGGLSFYAVLESFGPGLFLIPLLATMESIAVAKSFASISRYNILTTQEFIALGTVNVISSFFGSMPVTGGFSRTALAAQSGVRTPLAGFVTGKIRKSFEKIEQCHGIQTIIR